MNILFSNLWKTWSNLHLCQRSHLSIYLSVCLFVSDVFLSGSTLWILLLFCMRTFVICTRKKQSLILESYGCCVDSWSLANWVSKANLNQNQNICHLNKGNINFFLWVMPYNWLYDFVKSEYLGNICFSSHRPKYSRY